ncbi:mini-chromosome maintenance complex-binding protein-like [Liolophura sinensis]|uniref:mini-chromosome maintenance complex-binding protein-like n=1 Tax=Liolophura sinensis TaxID=3198878 RepID=UPI003158E73D
MPGLEDWLNSPLDIIQNLYEKHGNQYSQYVSDYFTERLKSGKAVSWVPSLNDSPLHELRANSVVRFRCMVQDMFDPEFYLGVYEVADLESGKTSLKCGKYGDIAQCGPKQVLRLASPQTVTLDRQTLYCIPIPGESEWVKTSYSESGQTKVSASPSHSTNHCKRSREVEKGNTCGNGAANMETSSPLPENTAGTMDTEQNDSSDAKRTRTTQQAGSSVAGGIDLNFPLKGETGPACLVKVYDNEETFKVNDCVEFFGILSVEPALAYFDNSDETEMVAVAEMSTEERAAHAPPPSLVPRLHVILTKRLQHNNPLIEDHAEDKQKLKDDVISKAAALRSQLLSVLQHALLGDALAAEYMLCHLLASVYARADVMPLGKFSINLSGVPKEQRAYPKLFYHLLSNLVTKSHQLPMTLSVMNQAKFSPEKDYSANRVKSGMLQLSADTHLMVDETCLEAGHLDNTGVQNVTALGNLIVWQKVEYDFCYHKQDFPASVPVLTLSEGKSLLPSDCHIPLCPMTLPEDMRTYYTELDSVLTPENLHKLRVYITVMKYTDYNMGEDIQKKIQDDFVDIRKDDPKSMTVDDFHALLNLVRLLSLSFGLSSANMEMWNKAKAMEVIRKQRVAQLPTTAGAQQRSS